jgi:hypothetical protein
MALEQAGVLTTAQATQLLTGGTVRGLVRSGVGRRYAGVSWSPGTVG